MSDGRGHRREVAIRPPECSRRMGLTLEADVEETPDNVAPEPSGESAELLRRKGEALDALQRHRRHGLPARMPEASSHYVVDCARVSQGQGHRAAADGEVPRGEGQAERHAPGDRSAQPVRAPSRPPHRRRGGACHSESVGDAFSKTVIISPQVTIAVRRRGRPQASCSPPPTPSSRSRRRPGAAASAWCGSRRRRCGAVMRGRSSTAARAVSTAAARDVRQDACGAGARRPRDLTRSS